MDSLFPSYRVPDQVYDEVFDRQGGIRPAYGTVVEVLRRTGPDELRSRAEFLRRTYIDQGVTFDFAGQEAPFPIDILPRVLRGADWSPVAAGVAQRVRALERFLADVYGTGDVFSDGVMPRRVVTSSPHFHRAVHRLEPMNGVRIHVAGIDLVRDGEGRFRVLEDNVRVPSGVSYVLTNRQVMTSALPEVANEHRVQPVQDYPQYLLAALKACAPRSIDDPTVVVLTPGVYNSAYFEHALLARMMGCELVEGRDLVCHSGRVSMRTTNGLRPVHVIYRRVDDEFLDPAVFRSDSLLGCAGLMTAARRGNVTLANAVGNGVADDKLVYTYVPDLIRYYLGEEPLLPGVDTWRLEDPAHREEVMDRLEELVVKPVDGSGGKGIVIGPVASKDEIAALRAKVLADPRGWIAQPVVQLSTVPTMIEGRLQPRHVDLRPFAVNDGSNVWVLPGGLTRVALPEGQLIVNSSQGGGSKDTWVLAEHGPGETRRTVPPASVLAGLEIEHVGVPDRAPEPQQEQQQQQQQQALSREATC